MTVSQHPDVVGVVLRPGENARDRGRAFDHPYAIYSLELRPSARSKARRHDHRHVSIGEEVVQIGDALLKGRRDIPGLADRVGRHNNIFRMPKFRSMRVGTPAVATHLLADPAAHLTPIGGFLRKSSLDELPQLWSILVGDMSFVGPRPALFNQQDLIELRTRSGVDELVPGLTGWAQINGRDELPIPDKVKLDAEYLQRRSMWFDLRILWLTFVKVIRRDGITH